MRSVELIANNYLFYSGADLFLKMYDYYVAPGLHDHPHPFVGYETNIAWWIWDTNRITKFMGFPDIRR